MWLVRSSLYELKSVSSTNVYMSPPTNGRYILTPSHLQNILEDHECNGQISQIHLLFQSENAQAQIRTELLSVA